MIPPINRRSIRLKGYDYSLEGAYFVTICTYMHIHRFGRIIGGIMNLNNYGKIAFSQWQHLKSRFALSDFSHFIIMPNHIHGIIQIAAGAGVRSQSGAAVNPPLRLYNNLSISPKSLGVIVRAYKSSVTYRLNLIRSCSLPPIWQRNYYEHIIRDDKEYSDIVDYMITNPMNWISDKLM